jgi:hypothetical protein
MSAPIREKDLMMSPTYYTVRIEQLDEQLEGARLAGDTPRTQELLAEKMLLMQAMVGSRLA